MTNTRLNALDLALDIAGSLTHKQNLNLNDEAAGLGVPVSGQTGSAAAVSTTPAGTHATITGLTGMVSASAGHFITLSGTNAGTYLIDGYVSAASVTVVNHSGVVADSGITWKERFPYSAEDDFNYARTDRAAIKGVNYYDAIPVYRRPTDVTTDVAANLANIATKTTDARGFIINRVFYRKDVAASNTLITLTSTGNLQHSLADGINKDGVPVFDTGPYVNDYPACFVEITDGYTDEAITVLTGTYTGEKVFGLTYNGSSTSPDSVEVHFFSIAHGTDITSGSHPYTWETNQTTKINTTYGYFQRLDELPDETFRMIYSLGISSDSALAETVNNILITNGTTSTDQSIINYLTHTDGYYAFNNMSAPVTIVEALNVLNNIIGNDTFTGNASTLITSGDTITTSLEDLANFIYNIQQLTGTSTNGVVGLTNTDGYYPFYDLSANPTIIDVVNILNSQIGNDTFTGTILTSGNTITQSLQALSTAITNAKASTAVTRLILRTPSDISAGTPVTIPNGWSYNLDSNGNGAGLSVYIRGILRSPGTVAAGDDYAETNVNTVTFFTKVRAGDHIDFFLVGGTPA